MTQAERDQRDADWRWVVSTAQGRRVVNEILASCGLVQPDFSDNPLRMAFSAGRRSIGGEIYARFTEVTQATDRAALLAEVLLPRDVRNSRRKPAADRDDAEPGTG